MMRLVNHRYQLEATLGKGGMGTVYRAHDRLTGGTVALKMLLDTEAITEPDDTKRSQMLMAREFSVLATLRHPNIISVLDYGLDRYGTPFFTMEYIPNAKDLSQALPQLTITERQRLVVQLLTALDFLHRRGILHGDLKPSNMLVHDGQLKLLDFGLVRQVDLPEATPSEPGFTGTVPYGAPELFLNKNATPASDLYTAGLLIIEILSGQYPFPMQYPPDLIRAIVKGEIDYSLLEQPGQTYTLPAGTVLNFEITAPEHATFEPTENALQRVVRHMTASRPDERYQDAYTVLQDFCTVTDLPLPRETESIRRGMLQKARFVGRHAELQQLENALEATLQDRGGLWVVHGESGVGKSRLLDELRIRALVQGFQVVRGTAAENANTQFQLWQEVLPPLMLGTKSDPQMVRALQTLVPNAKQLVQSSATSTGQTMPDTDSATISRDEIMSAILKLLKHHSTPTLLILDDLQWAPEAAELLQTLLPEIQWLPMLVIVSLRSDEGRAVLNALPDAPQIALERLEENDIVTLARSLLGSPVQLDKAETEQLSAREQEIVHYLITHSEGNTFFLLEALNALAQQAGELRAVPDANLPERLLPPSVQRLIERKLAQLSPQHHPILALAAVAGRRIDQHLLRLVMGADRYQDDWLYAAQEVQLVDVEDQQWQFAHDKYRDAILSKIPVVRRQALHLRLAEAFESAPDQLAKQRLPYLNHLRLAGAQRRWVTALAETGEVVLSQVLALPKVRTLFKQALLVAQRIAPLTIQIKLAMQHATVTYRLLEIPAARQAFLVLQQLAERANDTEHYITSVSRLGSLEARVGNIQTATRYFDQASTLLAAHPELDGVALDVELGLATMHIFAGNFQQSLTHVEASLKMLDTVQSITPGELESQRARLYLLKGYVLRSLGQREAALTEYLHGYEAYRKLNNRSALITACISVGSLLANLERLEEAMEYLQEGRQIIEETGANLETAQIESLLGEIADERGDYRGALEHYTIAINIHERTHTQDRIPWLLSMSATVHLKLNETTAGIAKAQQALQLARQYDAARTVAECVLVLYRLFMLLYDWEAMATIIGYGERQPSIHDSQLRAALADYDRLKAKPPIPPQQLARAYAHGAQLSTQEILAYIHLKLAALAT